MTDVEPGTYGIGTVHIGGAKSDGSPVAFVESAVCDECGGWASEVCVSGESRAIGEMTDIRVSRRVVVICYACPDHYQMIMDRLCDTYGIASNRYDPDELALMVVRESAERFQ